VPVLQLGIAALALVPLGLGVCVGHMLAHTPLEHARHHDHAEHFARMPVL
jgi:hypothetical protein